MRSAEPTPNFANLMLDAAGSAGRRTAIVDPPRRIDYAALGTRTLAFAESLHAAGVRPDDRVGIMLQRGADAAAALFGVLAVGGVAVIVNESFRPRQIEHVLGHSSARALVTSKALLERQHRPAETTAFTIDVDDVPATGIFTPVRRAGDNVAQIIYTSGSTGLPKGVTISHANLWAGMQTVVDYLGIRSDDRIASLLPFSFDYGLNQLLTCVGTSAALVVERSPVPQRIARTLREEAVTILPAVPPLWLQLLGVTAFEREPLADLRMMTNTGGRLPSDAVRRLRACQPQASLVLMYGLTEAFRSTYLDAEKVDSKPDSIGRAIPGAQILVLDEDGRPCRTGETGELVHRGPTVALGYWDDPAATAQVFRPNPLPPPGAPATERVVFSGDLVRRDEDGDLFFVGRRDRMIKTLGYRVSPDEVVDVLYASGEVAEAVVTAEPDDVRGSRIVAFVVLAPQGDIERLQAFCSEEMPRYMQPERIEVRSSLVRTPSGKFDVRAIARSVDDPG
jgi:amino acid adenylation domain-containing protein